MSSYDIIEVPCPKCKKLYPVQSKSGECEMNVYDLTAPEYVMIDANRHAPYKCDHCGCYFEIDIDNRQTVIVESKSELGY
jgi:hypothetical protein